MALSPRDLAQIRAEARAGTQEALENVGLFARTAEEITARRGEQAWLAEQYSTSQWLRKQIKRKGLMGFLFMLGLGAVLAIRNAPIEWLQHAAEYLWGSK